jgi:hypothetical protein
MLFQQRGNLRRLRRHKAQPISAVAPHKPPHSPVTKSAPSIKNHQQPAADTEFIIHLQLG